VTADAPASSPACSPVISGNSWARFSLYLRYWYKSTNTDAAAQQAALLVGDAGAAADSATAEAAETADAGRPEGSGDAAAANRLGAGAGGVGGMSRSGGCLASADGLADGHGHGEPASVFGGEVC
jgi:hypothetical protein